MSSVLRLMLCLFTAQVAGHGVNTLREVESSRLARTFWSMHVETIRFRTMNCSFVLNNSIMCQESLFRCYPSLWGPWWAIKPGFNYGTIFAVIYPCRIPKVLISHEREKVLSSHKTGIHPDNIELCIWVMRSWGSDAGRWSYAALRAPFGAFSPLPRCREFQGISRYYNLAWTVESPSILLRSLL